MKRTATIIYFETPSENPNFPTITRLPWVNNAPDFTGIEEPTLSVLINAWEAGKDNIEIIPDPEPIPEIKNPDWEGLATKVLGGRLFPLFGRLTSEAINSNPISIARNDINLAVTVLKNENALAASLKLLQQCGFIFTDEEKELWNNEMDTLGFSEITKL